MVNLNLSDKITENFRWSEFVCKDGTLRITEKTFELFQRLQLLRDIIGPIVINSGYRSPEYNKKVGGTEQSKHMEAEAVDIRWLNKSWPIEQVADIAEGIGFYVLVYDWGLHLDVRLIGEVI
jgi:uncharacterized protein YcbK (DUF882 family)